MPTFLVSDSISLAESAGRNLVVVTTDNRSAGDLVFLTDSASAHLASNLGQRGNIDYDQIRRSARAGDGDKFHTLDIGGTKVLGNTVKFDSAGNLIDTGFPPGSAIGGTVTNTGALTANLPVLGNSGVDVKIGTAAQLVPALPSDATKFLDGTGVFSVPPSGGGGSGTVTSVGLTVPAEFSVTGSPVTTSGTLAVAKANQNANLVYSGPSSGAAASPTFRALVTADLPSISSGALVLLEQHTASSSATLDFTAWYSSSYDTYQIEFIGLVPSSTSNLTIRFSTNGGSTYDSGSNYKWLILIMFSGATTSSFPAGSNSDTAIIVGSNPPTTSTMGTNGTSKLFDPGSTTKQKLVTTLYSGEDNNHPGNLEFASGGGLYTSTSAVNAFRILFQSGNITSGIVRVYGIAK